MPTLMIVKDFEFEAGHHLPNHTGACKYRHGHSYKLQIGISGPIDIHSGMIADFKQLKDLVKELIVDRLDHSYLNDLGSIAEFPAECPTAENMGMWMVKVLQPRLKITGTELALVKLWETSRSHFEWRA
jgi:6-pyruvoyltetrahydropterin/6-carboxytetrahydropterin synthase